jgi:hypothetical protein
MIGALVVRVFFSMNRIGSPWPSVVRLHPRSMTKGLSWDIPGATTNCFFRPRIRFAAMIRAALALYEATGGRSYLGHALA